MKKNIIVAALASLSVLSAASAFAADGQVNFKGEIIDSACTVANTPAAPLDVTLGQVPKSSFAATGDTAAPTKFTLKLTNCPATVTKASVKFDGTAANGDNSVLALTQETGVATGVGVQITDSSDKVLPLYTASASYPLVETAENSLDFVARYISTASTVTAGPANAVASFTVNYN